VTTTRDRAWLAKFIYALAQLLAAGDPIAKELFAQYKSVRMPNLALSQEDVAVLIEYLEKQDGTAAGAASSPAKTPAPAPASANADAISIVEPYLRIQEALSADTLTAVQDAADRIAVQAAKLGPTAASIQSTAAGIRQSGDLIAARVAFGSLSDAIITYAKTSGVSFGNGVAVAYCPMARKYWLQRGTVIRNPYYGESMLEVGPHRR
jgi:hypothetical protein